MFKGLHGSFTLIIVAAALGCPATLLEDNAEYCGSGEGALDPATEGCRRALQTSGGDPTPEPNAPAAGHEVCEGDRWNRAEAASCALCYDIRRCTNPNEGDCASDFDCASGEICAASGDVGCGCVEQCVKDEDCGEGFACICPAADPESNGWTATPYPKCLPAECRVNADCGLGGECGLAFSACGNVKGLRCRDSGADSCAGDADCDEQAGFTCQYDARDQRFRCDNDAVCD